TAASACDRHRGSACRGSCRSAAARVAPSDTSQLLPRITRNCAAGGKSCGNGGVADVVDQLAPRSPRRLLDDLAGVARQLVAAGRARPEIELALASGHTLRGRLIAVADEGDGAIALLFAGGSPSAPTVTFARV